MTLQQLAGVKRWHVLHRRQHPVEFHTWDSVLTLWLCGALGAPAYLLLGEPGGFIACGGLWFSPGLYVALRRRLHQAGCLRCDWLPALR